MAKQNTPELNSNKQPANNGINYACKPAKIGTLIKAMTKQRGWTPKVTAEKLKISKDRVYRVFKCTCLSIPDTMKWSEVFAEDLLLLYRSNVKPLPDPIVALQKENDTLRKENTALEHEKDLLHKENNRLEAQNELLREQVKEFAGKK